MAKDKRYQDTPVNTIPEVAAFEDVRQRLAAFKEANKAFFDYLDALSEEYNQKLEAADKAVRARGVSCGEFELYQYNTKYNPELLYQYLGRDRFLEVGGKIIQQTVYDVDKGLVDAAIASKTIPENIAGEVRKKEARYHKPDKAVLP